MGVLEHPEAQTARHQARDEALHEHLQPVVALLRRALCPSLSQALADGERKTGAWFARHRMAVVPFADLPDAFVNLNSRSRALASKRASSASKGGSPSGVSRIRAWRRSEAAITWVAPAWRRRWLSLPGWSMSKA